MANESKEDAQNRSAEVASVRKRNVEAMATMEAAHRHRRTPGERISDAIAVAAGQPWFLGLHAVWFVGWIILNSKMIRWIKPMDPFPFAFLTLITSLEAIFLSLFILSSQSRETKQADERAKLDLQINLLTESETTKLVQMVRALCAHYNLSEAHDPELNELEQATNPERLVDELKERHQVRATQPPDARLS